MATLLDLTTEPTTEPRTEAAKAGGRTWQGRLLPRSSCSPARSAATGPSTSNVTSTRQ